MACNPQHASRFLVLGIELLVIEHKRYIFASNTENPLETDTFAIHIHNDLKATYR